MFRNGVLSNGPAFFITGEGNATAFSDMKDGRPANGCQCREYWGEGEKMKYIAKDALTDVSGCITQVGSVNSDNLKQGFGKAIGDGVIQEGIYKNDLFVEGKQWVIND